MNTTVYFKEAKYEFLKKLRARSFSFATLGFPLMFYTLFGLLMNQSWGRINSSTYLLATYGTFGVMGVCLFGFGVSLAVERGLGWLELKQASPMPPAAYFVAKLAACLLFCLILFALMLALGLTFGGVHLSIPAILQLAGILIAGAIPFGALGLILGYLANANSAPSFIQMFYLPLSFCSGLWIPFEFLPKVVKQIAPYLPPYHLSQLALAVIRGDRHAADLLHWQALAAYTLLFLGVAVLLHHRDASRKNGLL